MKRIRITLCLLIFIAVATLVLATRAVAQATVVVGTGNPDGDVLAVQAAVNQGGQVIAERHFSFDRAPTIPRALGEMATVLVSQGVAISGTREEDDEMRSIERECKSNSSAHHRQASEAVLFWNEQATHSIVDLGAKAPPIGLVELAIVHTAIYDAVNAICDSPFTPYAVAPTVRYPALLDAAVAAAAHDTLLAMYPDQQEALDATYAQWLDQIKGHHRAKLNGIAVGQQAAAGILNLRANDGRYAGTPWDPPPPGPGVWEPTPPGYLPASVPWARDITPWTMESPSQFPLPPPPDLDSELWVHDYNQVKAYGGAVSDLRTPEQADLAKFFTDQPVLQWDRAWRGIAVNQRLSTLDASRFFAILTTASSDSLIGCWESKFTYAFWRPVTAIRVGGGNPNLEADPDWIGLVITPNHPEYPSAHAWFSGGVAEALRSYFGTDAFGFSIDSNVPNLMFPVRYYNSFSEALTDIRNARIYGGMHYENSTLRGADLGQQVAQQLMQKFFRPTER